MKQDVYIIAAQRTAIGSYLGAFKDVSPARLGADIIKDILNKTQLNPKDIDEVIVGNVLSSGQGQGLARQVSILGGIPFEVPAYAINMVCGSGLKAVMNGVDAISNASAHLVFVGGVESMSQAPYLVSHKTRSGHKMGDLTMVDAMIHDALTDAFDHTHMGITAENIAQSYAITREAQDAFAMHSQEKAINAIDAGVFRDEITPVTISTRNGDVVVDVDEYPNRNTSMAKLAKLRPAFKKEGTVTAGNASGINDGASFVLLADQETLDKTSIQPLARIVSMGQGGVDPKMMGMGPVPAINQALMRANLSLQDIDVLELNEAFAAQSLGVIQTLSETYNISTQELMDKTNIHGGAIALGHPVGASGNRILVTLTHELKRSQKRYGLASLCIGGGMGVAIIIESV